MPVLTDDYIPFNFPNDCSSRQLMKSSVSKLENSSLEKRGLSNQKDLSSGFGQMQKLMNW
jgi:hypothetical protein